MLYFFIILGIIQGATEFLPISSSGHLVLCYKIFGFENNLILLSVILHIATLSAVVLVYRKTILQLIKNPFCKTNINILISTVVTIVVVLIFKKYIEKSFDGNYLVYGFLITAFLLSFSELLTILRTKKSSNNTFLEYTNSNVKKNFSHDVCNLKISYFQAFMLGLFQGVACFPAISRSGSTIAGGLIFKTDKRIVADYSFLISIPIIIASLFLEVFEYIKEPISFDYSFWYVIIAFLFSFIIGFVCIKFMLVLVKKQKLMYFSIYLLALVVFLILNASVFKLF